MFVYTDGVTEATRADGALFGTDRLIESLNAVDDRSPQGILEKVKEGIAEFVGDAPQFDDTTMMCLYYIGEDHEL